MERGLEVLRKYKRLAETQRRGQDDRRRHLRRARGRATARTSWTGSGARSASGREAISGEEEARLIYLAALHSIHLEGRRALVVDIGGGSVELALGAGRGLEWVASREARRAAHGRGVRASRPAVRARTSSAWPTTSSRRWRATRRASREAALRRRRRHLGHHPGAGRAGAPAGDGRPPEALHHVTVKADAILRELRRRLSRTDLRERLQACRAWTRTRADIIVRRRGRPGHAARARCGVRSWSLCEWALREGILLDYIQRHPRSLARAEAYPDVRRRSVVALAERCQYDEAPRAARGATSPWRCSTTRAGATAWATRSARCSSTPRCSTTSATTSPTRATTSTRTT